MTISTKIKLLTEYGGACALVALMGIFPYRTASKIGYGLGLALTIVIHKRFKRSMADIQKAFPTKTPAQVKAIAQESWGNVGRIAAEFARASKMTPSQIDTIIKFENAEQLLAHANAGKGGILHMGHFTNWEVFGLFSNIALPNMAGIARPLSNPYVDKLITKMRSTFGMRMLSAYNPFFSCTKALKAGSIIAILSDQSVPSGKIYTKFMGRPAEVGPMSALLSLKVGVPIFPIQMLRKDGKLTASVKPALYPQGPYTHQSMVALTKNLQTYYEDWINQNPQDWLWGHNRWKREEESLQGLLAQEAQEKLDAQQAGTSAVPVIEAKND